MSTKRYSSAPLHLSRTAFQLTSGCILVFLSLVYSVCADPLEHIPLAGNLPRNLTVKDRPYLVTADIYVPSGKSVTIEPGVTILFKNFTGLHVEGQLRASGTPLNPVTFSSVYDQKHGGSTSMLPNPYDWNGIYIHESGIGSELSHCKVMYSVYGVSSLTKFIKIDACRFMDNGRSDIAIEGKKEFTEGTSFSFATSIDQAKDEGIPVRVLMDPNARKRTIARFSSLGVFAAGCGMAAWYATELAADNKRIEALQDTRIEDERSNLVIHSASDFEDAVSQRNRHRALMALWSALGLAGALGFSWSFTF